MMSGDHGPERHNAVILCNGLGEADAGHFGRDADVANGADCEATCRTDHVEGSADRDDCGDHHVNCQGGRFDCAAHHIDDETGRFDCNAQHVEAQHVEAQHVEAQHVEAQHVEAQHVEAQHVEAQHVEGEAGRHDCADAQHVDCQTSRFDCGSDHVNDKGGKADCGNDHADWAKKTNREYGTGSGHQDNGSYGGSNGENSSPGDDSLVRMVDKSVGEDVDKSVGEDQVYAASGAGVDYAGKYDDNGPAPKGGIETGAGGTAGDDPVELLPLALIGGAALAGCGVVLVRRRPDDRLRPDHAA